MKTTKESVFEFIQKQLMTNSDFKDGISTKVIAEYFQLQRSNVSTLLNELVKDERLEKTNTRPVLYYLPQKEAGNELNTVGRVMIGTDGSLANALQVAKAAILYPNNSLNVLVTAKPGSGTTHFVYTLYLYGKEAGVFSESAPIYKIIVATTKIILRNWMKNCLVQRILKTLYLRKVVEGCCLLTMLNC